jgi:hypothetical protein
VSNFEDSCFAAPVVDQVDDPKSALPHTVAIVISRELLASLSAGVLSQRLDSRNDALANALGVDRFNLLCGLGLEQKPIFAHAA